MLKSAIQAACYKGYLRVTACAFNWNSNFGLESSVETNVWDLHWRNSLGAELVVRHRHWMQVFQFAGWRQCQLAWEAEELRRALSKPQSFCSGVSADRQEPIKGCLHLASSHSLHSNTVEMLLLLFTLGLSLLWVLQGGVTSCVQHLVEHSPVSCSFQAAQK